MTEKEQSFPIEEITGSYAGSWPNFIPGMNGSASYTVDLIVNITQSWSGSNITPLGLVSFRLEKKLFRRIK